MTKQEIMIDYADFLATVLEGKGPEKLPVEGPLIDATCIAVCWRICVLIGFRARSSIPPFLTYADSFLTTRRKPAEMSSFPLLRSTLKL